MLPLQYFIRIPQSLDRKMNITRKMTQKGLFMMDHKFYCSNQTFSIDVAPQKLNDTVFIRHAHSQFNKACEDYRIKHNIDYDWDALRSHKGFDDAVAYNPLYIDCPLTQKGYEQCYLTSQNLDLNHIDVILVSPHNRALQTCQAILKHSTKFGEKYGKIPVIVQPLIAGSLWSSCDISDRLDKKIKIYPEYDFSKVSSMPQLWYTSNLKDSDKQKIQELIKRRKLKNYEDKQRLVLELLKNEEIIQSSKILRQRVFMIKNELKRLKEKHCNFLLISHYYVIQYMNTRAFREFDNKPVDNVDLKNCSPYYNNLEKILSYR